MNAVESAYRKNREFHGGEFKSLGAATEVLWRGGERSQRDRFEQIVRALPDLSGTSLLDVGCGFGDLKNYVDECGYTGVQYTGIDLCEEMVQQSQERLPDSEFFLQGMIEHEQDGAKYDFVVGSGIFAMPSDNWAEYVKQTVQSMFNACRSGVAINFLSSYSQAPSDKSRYANPGETLEMLMKQVTPWATLAHDYRWNDFTIALFRDQRS